MWKPPTASLFTSCACGDCCNCGFPERQSCRPFRFDIGPLHGRLWYRAIWHCDVTQVGANVNIVVDLANGPPNTVSWAKTGAADFQLFKFNATGVALGDISVVQTFAGQTLAGKHRNLQRGRHRAFQFRDRLHHLRERGSWDHQRHRLQHC